MVHTLILHTNFFVFSFFTTLINLKCPSFVFTAIEIGFTQRRINQTEVLFGQFDTLINKSRVSEQTFIARIELSTLNSPFGQSATRDEDFQITGAAIFDLRIDPTQPSRQFAYQILGDKVPENQEVFQLSVTPAIGSPTFTCTEANGCFQQLEIVISDPVLLSAETSITVHTSRSGMFNGL